MSKKLGPRGWKATIYGMHEVYAVTEHRGSVAGRIFQSHRAVDCDIPFAEIKVRRCPQIDHLPDGFWRMCWQESDGPFWSEDTVYDFSKEDREWMASLREPGALAMRCGAETEGMAA